jgi:nodulation protein E
MMRRVVITGAGTVNALGHNLAQTWDAMRDGVGAIGPLVFADSDRLTSPIGAMVRDWRPEAHFTPRQLPLLDPISQFALVAAREAVAGSGLDLAAGDPGRCGVIIGTAAGGHRTWNDAYRAVYAEGRARVNPLTVPRLMANAPVSQLSMEFDLRGPAFAVSSACASANHAIGLAARMIQWGEADVMLAGGTEAMLNFGGLKAWEGLRVISSTGCRPFCESRDGMVMGEGAGILVLEEAQSARRRGAPILAEIVGFAQKAEAHHIVQPSRDGQKATMQAALAQAALAHARASLPGYIKAHGTGTVVNDRTEAAAIGEVLGGAKVPVSSTKGMHGHAIGAAGAIEICAALLALKGTIPANIGMTRPDPECAHLDLVADCARQANVTLVLANSFAFGGLNACLVLARA